MHVGTGKSRTFCCVAHAVQQARRSTSRRAQQARHVRYHERDRRDTQLSLLCSVYKVVIAVIRFNIRINFICELK